MVKLAVPVQFDLEGVCGSNEAWHCAIKFVVFFVCLFLSSNLFYTRR